MAGSPDTYRGWSIIYDPPSIPSRSCDWCAVPPDYDGPDGIPAIYGPSRDAVCADIDAWIEDHF